MNHRVHISALGCLKVNMCQAQR